MVGDLVISPWCAPLHSNSSRVCVWLLVGFLVGGSLERKSGRRCLPGRGFSSLVPISLWMCVSVNHILRPSPGLWTEAPGCRPWGDLLGECGIPGGWP